ncbi:uncharacterized protein FisN_13Hh140 [Fistulifera solaris]|uniref:MOSC domain-containing protein n=1 Tax=Fistulifera solaris TaxID=1519565 RepID=A0A1Z5KP97_FISSO|nr:uncharacterized protein FisN_13Hh140 [Fistulifera solaris]|eukprot:GAX27758.1 uncharacterized protein FisN_13Hh140 [Fistulifera solaris]
MHREQIPIIVFTVLVATLATTNFTRLRHILSTIVSRFRLHFIVVTKPQESDSKRQVSQLHTYPIKSLRAIDQPTVQIEKRGLVGDRGYMLVVPAPLPAWGSFGPKDPTHRFLTQRQCPSLATVVVVAENDQFTLTSHLLPNVQATFSTQPISESPKYRATLWGDCVQVEDMGDTAAQFLQSIVDQDSEMPDDLKLLKVRLVVQCPEDVRVANEQYVPAATRGWFGQAPVVALSDGFPILIANDKSLEELNRRLQAKGKALLSMRNFRPNIVVAGLEPFEEDRWKVIRIGNAILHVVKGCPRCKQSCTDQTSGKVSAEPLETMAEFRALEADSKNVYFAQNVVPSPSSVGSLISVGDSVEVLEWGEPVWGD